MIHKNQSPLFECQNGFKRREWLANLHNPMRPAVRRMWRRVKKAIDVVTFWAAGIAAALVIFAVEIARVGM